MSIDALAAIIVGDGEYYLRTCAVRDLAARGAPVVPLVLGMLGTSDSTIRSLALGVLGALGPDAQAALPALMEMIRTAPDAVQHDNELYEAVSAIGAAARPAIPLLIVQSGNVHQRYPALRALGRLGKYDAQRVVPHLTGMLEDQTDVRTVLDALRDIGKQARTALPATLASLERAKAAGDSMHGAAAVLALVAIGEPHDSVPLLTGLLYHPMLAGDAITGLALIGPPAARAVPALIEKLNSSRQDLHLPNNILSALAEIAPTSPAVQQQLLVDATQHDTPQAAYWLAHAGPLPSHFAPALIAALARKPGDVFLGLALQHTQQAR